MVYAFNPRGVNLVTRAETKEEMITIGVNDDDGHDFVTKLFAGIDRGPGRYHYDDRK